MTRFANLWFLALLLFAPALYYWYRSRRAQYPTLKYSDLKIIGNVRHSGRSGLVWLPRAFRIAALVLLTVAVARPQYGVNREEVVSKGIDIVMVIDNSGSMASLDPEPGAGKINPNNTRLEVAKQVIRDFVSRRGNDSIGLVTFAGKAYYQCPLTLDYGILLTFLDGITNNEKDPQTAIGDALGTAVLHLKDSKAKSKVVVLVTDGESNTGILSPTTAAQAAAQYKIKVYTVGVGNPSGAYRVAKDFFGDHLVPVSYGLDEATLQDIARVTGAQYFHADNPSAMADIFRKIDEMEKTDVKMKRYTEYSEKFTPWAIAGLLLLTLEIGMAVGPMRTNP